MNKYQQQLEMLYTNNYDPEILYIADYLWVRDIKFDDYDLRLLYETRLINNIKLTDFLDLFGAYMYDQHTTRLTLELIKNFAKENSKNENL